MKLNSGWAEGAFGRLKARRAQGVTFRADGTQNVRPGCHYMAADYGFLNVGHEIGTVLFHGKAFGPGNTDTIYRRLAPVTFGGLDLSETIPIELVALSVHSLKPITIKGQPYDMQIRLTEGQRSFGEMSMALELPDDGTGSGVPHGIFHKSIHIHFTCHFTPAGSDKEAKDLAVSNAVYISTVRPGTWSFNAWPHAVIVAGKDRPTTNFFVTSNIYMLDSTAGAGGSKVGATTVNV